MTDKPTKPCERCATLDAIKGERFCKSCKKAVIAEAFEDGKARTQPQSSL